MDLWNQARTFFRNSSLENPPLSPNALNTLFLPHLQSCFQLTNLIPTNQQQLRTHLQCLHTGFGINLKESGHKFQSLATSMPEYVWMPLSVLTSIKQNLKVDRPTK